VVEFRILGPLEVVDGRALPLGGGKRGALLASLLVRANSVVATDRLIDDLWGEQPPVNAKASLHNTVSQLRQLLGHDVLEMRPPGYVLRVAPDQLDSSCFELLRRRAVGESPDDRADTLQEALYLWRGDALVDFAYEDFAQAEIMRLAEMRVVTLEDLCAVRLELGEGPELVAELEALVAEYPYRERLRRLLMLALYRSGRAVDAIRVFVRWQARLRDEWDMEPGRDIQRTASDIREHDPALDDSAYVHADVRERIHASPSEAPIGRIQVEIMRVALGYPDELDRLTGAEAAALVERIDRDWDGWPKAGTGKANRPKPRSAFQGRGQAGGGAPGAPMRQSEF